METKILADGSKWLSCDVLVCGDYGGAGSVGAANIKALREQFATVEEYSMGDWNYDPPQELISVGYEDGVYVGSRWTDIKPDLDCNLVVTYGAYSSEQAWLRETDEAHEILAGLEDYPLIDDEAHSELEMEWESEAWENYVRSDLYRMLAQYDRPADELETEDDEASYQFYADELNNDQLFTCYRSAMDKTNTYPETEYSGSYVDLDRIIDAYAEAVRYAYHNNDDQQLLNF